MKTLVDQLSQYALYHRDKRNIATHFFGIPMIVLGVAVLLGRPQFEVGTMALSPAAIVAAVGCLYYLILSLPLGLIMSVLFGAAVYCSHVLAAGSTGVWLSAGIGLFVVGWVIQFVGHYYEGKKPAFVDDIMGLAIGPLFVVAEACFMLGMFKKLEADIVARSGETYIRDMNSGATPTVKH
ncbi:DUF962 domain-containing protein [Allohahella marinimesophila]|uniref:DUF962 domain-containing protein n=1 Tax=Allohahella marinimesophila TaxID=1054972 RepID=A0ABP7PBC4_9GAMM